MKKLFLFAITNLSVFTASFAFDGNGSLTSASQNRTFVFHAPGAAVGADLPLVIVMHGDGGSGSGIKGYAGFDAVADAQNFIAVYPDAMGGSWNRYVDDQPGDAGLGNPNAPDDVLFISDLIDYFCETYHINPTKIYATGHSAGGYMAYNLAVKLPNRIAAFAPVAASLWGDNTYVTDYFTNNYVQVPIYHIHGDNDGTVAYPDPDHLPVAYQEWPLSGFSAPNCNATTYSLTQNLVTGVNKLTFCDGTNTNGKKVELVQIVNGGHGWPGVAGYNAAAAIWDFLKNYGVNAAAGCQIMDIAENGAATFTLQPNPATDVLNIGNMAPPFKVSIQDIFGRTLLNQTAPSQALDISGLPAGTYYITVQTPSKSSTQRFIKY